MVRSLNKVMLIGNLTRPPVLKKTTSGAVVVTMGIATNTAWKNAAGEQEERAEYIDIVAWNKLAEICAQLLDVGMLVYVEGELRKRSWDDASGRKNYRTEIKINDMKLLDSKQKKGIGIEAALKAGESNGPKEDYVEPEVPATHDEEETKKEAEDLF